MLLTNASLNPKQRRPQSIVLYSKEVRTSRKSSYAVFNEHRVETVRPSKYSDVTGLGLAELYTKNDRSSDPLSRSASLRTRGRRAGTTEAPDLKVLENTLQASNFLSKRHSWHSDTDSMRGSRVSLVPSPCPIPASPMGSKKTFLQNTQTTILSTYTNEIPQDGKRRESSIFKFSPSISSELSTPQEGRRKESSMFKFSPSISSELSIPQEGRRKESSMFKVSPSITSELSRFADINEETIDEPDCIDPIPKTLLKRVSVSPPYSPALPRVVEHEYNHFEDSPKVRIESDDITTTEIKDPCLNFEDIPNIVFSHYESPIPLKRESVVSQDVPNLYCNKMPVEEDTISECSCDIVFTEDPMALYEKPRVILNISGQRFETFESTLNNFPDTLLGNPLKRRRFYHWMEGEYVINRNYYIFNAILFYYQSGGILSRPDDVDRQSFMDEIEFFEIKDHFDMRHKQEMTFMAKHAAHQHPPKGKIKRFIWETLEMPSDSNFGRFVFYSSLLVLITSIIAFCAETIPALNSLLKEDYLHLSIWYILETAIFAYFLIEYTLRVYSAPMKWRYLTSPLGFVDLISVIPFLIASILEFAEQTATLEYNIMRALIILRVLRIFKLARYNEGFFILIMTVRDSIEFLLSVMLMITASSLIFAGLVFYCELFSPSTPPTFNSVFDTLWYTVITQTTVGYGDYYPLSTAGKFFGSMCAICGAILFCIPLPVLVFKFVEYYYLYQLLHEQRKERLDAIINMRKNLTTAL